MYQSVYYCHKTYTYYLRDSIKGWSQFQYPGLYYKRIPQYKEGALPILTGGWGFPTKKYDKNDPDLLEKDLNKELYLLRELYYKEDDKVPLWHNTLFLDIETQIGGALTGAFVRDAPMPLTSIALLDKTTKQKICFIVDKSSEITETIEENKKIIPVQSEEELIQKFLSKYEELDPTIVVTYNGADFDIPYLYFRIKRVLGESEALRLSPIKKINVQEWGEKNVIRLGGVNHLDFMLLIKKYSQKEEPSYKLGDIGFKHVNLGKIEYEGNLNQLFKRDKQLFIDYNLRDVEILDKLEEKLKFIELTILLSHICNIPYDQVYYNTVMNEGAILKHLKREGIISPNKPTTTNPSLKDVTESYAGGYIKEPVVGLYEDVIDLDFASEYPSTIKAVNIGVETLIGRILSDNNPNYEQNLSFEKLKEMDPNKEIIIQRLDTNVYKLDRSKTTVGKIINIIEKNKYTVTASGGIYRTDIKSVAAQILEGWFEKREYYRGLKKNAGKNKDWDNYALFDLFQHSFKILQNSLYGTYAKNTWRYSDGHKICSASITNSGQRLVQETITFTNNFINNKLLKMSPEELLKYLET